MREIDKSDWIQVKHKNSPKTKLTSLVNSITTHNVYGILSHSDDPIPDDKTIYIDPYWHNRTRIYMNTAGNARSHGASISNERYVY